MANNQQLELHWIGKDKPIAIEPRILIENPKLSFKESSISIIESNDIFDNILIHGDNLLALKALEKKFAGKVKCIFIDPPYNTGSAFEHYDDNLEHSIWLNLMTQRLYILKNLLTEDGTIWIILDDSEVHYLKVVCDELWGRNNFISDITWNSRKSVSNDAIISMNTNHILVYATNADTIRQKAKKGELFKGPIDETKFSNPDNDPRGKWIADPFDAPNIRPNLTYPVVNPNTGVEYWPPKGRCWRTTLDNYKEALADNRIVFGKTGKSKPQLKRFLSECSGKGSVLTNLWNDLDTTTNATKHSQQLFNKPFTNPKPEDLVARCIELATKPGDIVFDSFLGSGTTSAVAHKLHRRWIGIEMGDQAYDYCKVRMDLVIKNQDMGGITKVSSWKGGGGYKFYELAPTLINIDSLGEAIINKQYSPDMLASAVALHEGFEYCPDQNCFWKQSKSTENAYLYVTTNHVDLSFLKTIERQLSDTDYLLVACKSFDSACQNFDKRIKIKKIPQMLLGRCEFNKNNYDLNIINPPVYEEEDEDE